jgi:histone deacetylase 1/2
MRETLLDFGVMFDVLPILCDNESAVKIATSPVEHSRTNHIDIMSQFIRDHINKGDINIDDIGTNDQLADIFTKPLDEKMFYKLRNELNIMGYSNVMTNLSSCKAKLSLKCACL